MTPGRISYVRIFIEICNHNRPLLQARSHLELLNAEYRRQAAAREAELRQRLDRCRDLETQLEKAIEAVRGQEQQVQRERTELGRERGRAAAERRDAAVEVERVTQRLQAEYEFKLQAERRRHAFIVNQLRHGKPKTPVKTSLFLSFINHKTKENSVQGKTVTWVNLVIV